MKKVCPLCKGPADIEQVNLPYVAADGRKGVVRGGYFVTNCCAKIFKADLYAANKFVTKWIPSGGTRFKEEIIDEWEDAKKEVN